MFANSLLVKGGIKVLEEDGRVWFDQIYAGGHRDQGGVGHGVVSLSTSDDHKWGFADTVTFSGKAADGSPQIAGISGLEYFQRATRINLSIDNVNKTVRVWESDNLTGAILTDPATNLPSDTGYIPMVGGGRILVGMQEPAV